MDIGQIPEDVAGRVADGLVDLGAADLAVVDLGGIDAVAARLASTAEGIERIARQVRGLADGQWCGRASEAFDERIEGHHRDLLVLADRTRSAARRVREVEATARRRLAVVQVALPGSGGPW